MTSFTLAPSCSRAAWQISKQRLACAAGSFLPTVLPSEPSGAVPETAIALPILSADGPVPLCHLLQKP